MGRPKKVKTQDSDQVVDTVFPKKWAKSLDPQWMETAETFSTDEIKDKILKWEDAISSSEKDLDQDRSILDLRDKIADLQKDLKDKVELYKESIQQGQAQIKYCIHILQQRGIFLNKKEDS